MEEHHEGRAHSSRKRTHRKKGKLAQAESGSVDPHITEAYLQELSDRKEMLSEANLTHIAECEECGQLLTAFLKRYIEL